MCVFVCVHVHVRAHARSWAGIDKLPGKGYIEHL